MRLDAAKKQAFYARLVELRKEKPGVRPEDVMINLIEDKPGDWSFGNGVGPLVQCKTKAEIYKEALWQLQKSV